jgi:hypothetical protein
VFKKLIAPVIVGAVLVGGAGGAAVANAATVTPAATTHVSAGSHLGLKRWLRDHRREVRRAVVAISAKTIGVSPQNLVSELRSGKTIAEVATDHNVSSQSVIDALVHAADARISQAVTNHKLTSSEASKIEAKVPGLAAKVANHQFGQR